MTTVGIFSPSSSAKFIENNPLRYSYLKDNVINVYEHPQTLMLTAHTAGSIKDRINAIYDLLKDPKIDILMAYWGGANTNELLPHLDFEMFKKYEKPIVGYSDTSALLLTVNKFAGIKTYMGPCGVTFDKLSPFKYSLDYFKKVIIEKQKEVIINDSETYADDEYWLKENPTKREIKKNEGRKIYKEGEAEGEILASNLQTLMVLAGTKYFPNLENKILFLEEEELQPTSMIHRFFTHLSEVCDLQKVKGICIGRFCEKSGFSKDDPETFIYDRVFSSLNIPIIYNLDFGHSDPLFTIPIGGKCYINTKENVIKFM